MSKPANVASQTVMSKPYWAQYDGAPSVDKTCDVVRNPIWQGCANCAAKAVKVYSKYVKLFSGVVATCITLIGAFLTLHLLLDRVPNPIEDLKMVCLPAGDIVAPGPVVGNGGFVEWEGAPPQKIKSYYCVKNCGSGPCCLGQAPVACEAAEKEDGGQRTAAGIVQAAVGNAQSAAGNGEGSREGAKALSATGDDGERQGSGTSAIGAVGAGLAPTAVSHGMAFECGKLRVIEYGKVLEYSGRTYCFGGVKRWELLMQLVDAKGAFVKLGRNFKAYFSNGEDSRFFFNAAIVAKGPGRKGNGQYRLKI